MRINKKIILLIITFVPSCTSIPNIVIEKGTGEGSYVYPETNVSPGEIFNRTSPPVTSKTTESITPQPSNTNQTIIEKMITGLIIYLFNEKGEKIILSSYPNVINNSRDLLAGKSDQLLAEISYSDGSKSNEIEFISSNPDILQVDKNGFVKAKASIESNYNVTITARAKGLTGAQTNVNYNVLHQLPFATTISGKVFDINNNIVVNARVYAIDIENKKWNSDIVFTNNEGEFFIQNVPADTILSLSAGKDGYTSNSRNIKAKYTNLNEINTNVFNFGGTNIDEKNFAIMDQPEITEIKINNKIIELPGANNTNILLPETETVTPNNNFDPNLELKFTFSEPVQKNLFEDIFSIVSQKFSILNDKNFVLTNESGLLRFEWLDEKTVNIKTLRPLLQEINNEARYKIEFRSPFKDLNGLAAIEKQYIKFNQDVRNDFVVFSVFNDKLVPELVSARVIDGGDTYKDKIILNFNKLIDVIGNYSCPLLLTDPKYPENKSLNKIVESTMNSDLTNNVTIFGFGPTDKSNLMVTYAIGKLDKNKKLLVPLNGVNDNKSFNISGDLYTITMEFNNNVFEHSDYILISLGSTLNGTYLLDNDQYNLNTVINYPFAEIYDPAGNLFSSDTIKIIKVE